MTEIPPRESDYRPLRIIGDQMRIGDIVWTLRNRRKAGGVLRAECRHDASGDAWGEMTVTLAATADGYTGRITIDGLAWRVRAWRAGTNGIEAEAAAVEPAASSSLVSDDEFDRAVDAMCRVAKAG